MPRKKTHTCMCLPEYVDPVAHVLDLPFPISTNALWRSDRGRVHTSNEYHRWIGQADGALMEQKPPGRPVMLGKFWFAIVLQANIRARRDGDNHLKCCLDWCQRVGLVHNDRDCDGGSWRWGDAPAGCRITLTGERYVDR
jgi:Holliday junction resolvase RusA-like endonuclease